MATQRALHARQPFPSPQAHLPPPPQLMSPVPPPRPPPPHHVFQTARAAALAVAKAMAAAPDMTAKRMRDATANATARSMGSYMPCNLPCYLCGVMLSSPFGLKQHLALKPSCRAAMDKILAEGRASKHGTGRRPACRSCQQHGAAGHPIARGHQAVRRHREVEGSKPRGRVDVGRLP